MAAKRRKKTRVNLARAVNPSGDELNLDELRSLIALCKDSGVADLQIRSKNMKVSISFNQQRVSEYFAFETRPHPVPAALLDHSRPHDAAREAPGGGASDAPTAEAQKKADEDLKTSVIPSPMVGTFYRAPSPEADPYVEIGSAIEENTVLCIIEAMKLMNEIKAEMRGVLTEVLVENGQPVEYGQPLFRVAQA